MKDKVLIIIKDTDTFETTYFSVTNGVDQYFKRENGKTAMHNAKKWAKENGYTHLKVLSNKMNVNDQLKKL